MYFCAEKYRNRCEGERRRIARPSFHSWRGIAGTPICRELLDGEIERLSDQDECAELPTLRKIRKAGRRNRLAKAWQPTSCIVTYPGVQPGTRCAFFFTANDKVRSQNLEKLNLSSRRIKAKAGDLRTQYDRDGIVVACGTVTDLRLDLAASCPANAVPRRTSSLHKSNLQP